MTKVILVDKTMEPILSATTQQATPEDDSFGHYSHGLQEPPYNLDSLLRVSELHPTHMAALDQKASDIAGTGWEWVKTSDTAEDSEKDALEEWFTGLADDSRDETTSEILTSAWGDVECFGHGAIELARDGDNVVRSIFPTPGHTLRFARDNIRVAQGREGKRTWFKRWVPGDTHTVDPRSGGLDKGGKKANELLILRRPSRRSSWYGVPTYISALGWLHLSLAARDDNIHYFNNRREPRWAVILNNIEDEDGGLEDALRQAFSTSLAQPHRNVFIPIEGDGSIDFKQLSSDTKDMSFEKLQERADSFILLAHKMPPERLGFGRVGPLGGNATMAASLVYKEAVVSTAQSFLAERVNRFIRVEWRGADGSRDVNTRPGWAWKPKELDLTEEAQDVTTVVAAFQSNLMRLDEARAKLKLPPVDDADMGQKFFYELVPEAAAAAGAASAGAFAGSSLANTFSAQRNANALAAAEGDIKRRILDTLRPGASDG